MSSLVTAAPFRALYDYRNHDYRTKALALVSRLSDKRRMQRLTDEGMTALGGTRAVAEMLDAPASTVQSFKDRITRSRVNHLKLAAAAKGKDIDWDRALEPVAENAEAA